MKNITIAMRNSEHLIEFQSGETVIEQFMISDKRLVVVVNW